MGAGGQGGGGRASLALGSRWRSFPTRPLPHTRARPRARPGAAGQGLDRAGPGRGRRGGKRKQLQAGARSIGAHAHPAAHGYVAYRPFPETCCWGVGGGLWRNSSWSISDQGTATGSTQRTNLQFRLSVVGWVLPAPTPAPPKCHSPAQSPPTAR